MKRIAYTVALLSLGSIATAQTPPGFVGVYTDRTVDSVASLAMLPDQTFCFAMIAGALDVNAPGKWEHVGQEGEDTLLKLTRTRTLPSRFVLASRTPVARIAGQKPPPPELVINTAAFSLLQPDVVFGSSDRSETPANLAPMFAPGQNSFSRSERLPLQHRYLFLGYPTTEGGWKITRFDIGRPRHPVLINLSEEAAQAGTVWQARFRQGHLYLEQSDLGAPRRLKPGEAQTIRQDCLSAGPQEAGITLFKPQAEYRIDTLPGKQPWFAQD